MYNKQDCISNTITSVLDQTYRNFELIIVNDGSTDNSLDVALSFQDERIRVLSKSNGGVSQARNFGIDNAIGEFIFLLDADDLIKNDCLETLINLNSSYPTLNVFCANFDMTSADLMTSQSVCSLTLDGLLSAPDKLIWQKKLFLRTGNVLFRKECIKSVGYFNESIHFFEDMDFFLRFIKCFSVVYSPKVVLTYILENNELSVKPVSYENDWISHVSFKGKSLHEMLIIASVFYFSCSKRIANGDYINVLKFVKRHFFYTPIILLSIIIKLIYKIRNGLSKIYSLS